MKTERKEARRCPTVCRPGTEVRVDVNGENGMAVMVGERMETWEIQG